MAVPGITRRRKNAPRRENAARRGSEPRARAARRRNIRLHYFPGRVRARERPFVLLCVLLVVVVVVSYEFRVCDAIAREQTAHCMHARSADDRAEERSRAIVSIRG